MADGSDTRLLVLHALRLKGFAEADDVAALAKVDVEEVNAQLESLQASEFVLRRDGRLSGWALTAAGRAAQEAGLRAELAACGARDEVLGAYKRFLDLNTELLAVCTSWQMRNE